MIGRLRGVVVCEEAAGTVVLDVHGVGYELTTPLGAVARARRAATDDVLELFVHTHVREDGIELFGFASEAERRVFRLMIGVPNVGPRTALNALSALPLAELTHAVHAADVARLSRVPGIGKKTAERLVLELRGKLAGLESEAVAERPEAGTEETAERLVAALTNMGYRAAEAERAVRSLGDRVGGEPVPELLRQALAWLTP